MASAKIRIIDSTSKIEKGILGASEPEIKRLFTSAKPKIESAIKTIVVKSLMDCPEIRSLREGTLRMDFGLVLDPADDIIYSVANSSHVLFKNFRFYKNSMSNVMSIYIQPSDFQNLLSLPVANVITERMEVLPWLEWLLTAGDATVIYDYSVEYGAFAQSRTGAAIMVPTGFFRVDPKYSGTPSDNFITRALEKYAEEISNTIRDNL